MKLFYSEQLSKYIDAAINHDILQCLFIAITVGSVTNISIFG